MISVTGKRVFVVVLFCVALAAGVWFGVSGAPEVSSLDFADYLVNSRMAGHVLISPEFNVVVQYEIKTSLIAEKDGSIGTQLLGELSVVSGSHPAFPRLSSGVRMEVNQSAPGMIWGLRSVDAFLRDTCRDWLFEGKEHSSLNSNAIENVARIEWDGYRSLAWIGSCDSEGRRSGEWQYVYFAPAASDTVGLAVPIRVFVLKRGRYIAGEQVGEWTWQDPEDGSVYHRKHFS